MSEKIKSTLFRFRSLRAPDLISSSAKEDYFIRFPDPEDGDFFDAVTNWDPQSETKREALVSAADTFDTNGDVLTETQIKEIDVAKNSEKLYDLGVMLITTRNTTDFATIDNFITNEALVVLDTAEEKKLWNNLFYQTITQESSYLREMLIKMLLANYIVNKIGDIGALTDPDDGIKKFANSRVVLPKTMFSLDNHYESATTSTNTTIDTSLLDRNLKATECTIKAEIANEALKEIEAAEVTYENDHNAAAKSAIDAQQLAIFNQLDPNQSPPTLVTWTDPLATGVTIDVLPNTFSHTALSFTAAPQIDIPVIEAGLTGTSKFILNDNSLLSGNSFVEVKNKIVNYAKGENDTAFENTDFNLESIEVNGTAIPTCKIESRYNQKNSYKMKAFNKDTNEYGLLLSVDVGVPCLKLNKMEAYLDGEVGDPTFTKFKAVNRDGILTIDITPKTSANITNPTVQLAGNLTFDDGSVLSWDDILDVADGTAGVMSETNSEQGNPGHFVPSEFGLKRLGISDYRKVESQLCCYVPGEVSHIENVLAREYKERSTRRLRKSDTSVTTSTEVETENLTDTTSTSRYDMQKEISEVIASDTEYGNSRNSHSGFNANLTAKFGQHFSASAGYDASTDTASNFATSNSKEKSNNQSVQYSKELTEKALERVVSKVKEERTVKIIEEFEEQNRHGFDNRRGGDHVSGVYRWIDKIYKNQVLNYGKRLQYEFMIPEPSAFHLIAKSRNASSANNIPLVKPLDPRGDNFGSVKPLKSAADITEDNYQQWAAMYKAEVSAPPALKKVAGKSFTRPTTKQWYFVEAMTDKIPIPEGYGLHKAIVSGHGHALANWSNYAITVGDNTREYYMSKLEKQIFMEDNKEMELDKFIDEVPVSVTFMGIEGGMVGISLELKRKEELFVNWQLDTYNAIIEAYDERLLEFKDGMAELEAKRGVLLSDNPGYYQDIMNTVLKKNCIAYLVGHTNIGKSHTTGKRMKDFFVNITEDMDKYGATVKFFEQAFEWDNMDYMFYPFYWASRDRWEKLYSIENDDPLFRSFLQAGMARTILTVRPGFEDAVLFYMETGQIWNGGEVPIIGDDLHLSVVEEMKEPAYTLEESWEIRVPSTLTILQEGSLSLTTNETSGLPCYCDSGADPDEAFAHATVLSSLPVYIEGYSDPESPPA